MDDQSLGDSTVEADELCIAAPRRLFRGYQPVRPAAITPSRGSLYNPLCI